MPPLIPPGGGMADQTPICGEVRFSSSREPMAFCLWDVHNEFMTEARQCLQSVPVAETEVTLADYNEQMMSIRINGQVRLLAPALRPAELPAMRKCHRRAHDHSFKSATASKSSNQKPCIMLRIVLNDGPVRHYFAIDRDVGLTTAGDEILSSSDPCSALRDRVLTELWRSRRHKKKLFLVTGEAALDSDSLRELAKSWGATATVATTNGERRVVLIVSPSVGVPSEFSILGRPPHVVITTEIASPRKFTLVVPLSALHTQSLGDRVPHSFVDAGLSTVTAGRYIPITSSAHRGHIAEPTIPMTSATLGSWLADKVPTGLRASEEVLVLGFADLHRDVLETTYDGMHVALRRASTLHCCARLLDARFLDPRTRISPAVLNLNRAPARIFMEPSKTLRVFHFKSFAVLGGAGVKHSPTITDESDMTTIQNVFASLFTE
jgi:hypothetical protein